MRVEIRRWETTPDYYVRIGDDIFEMSRYADLPNGVCICLGSYNDIDAPNTMPLEEIPIGIVRQILLTLGVL